MTVLKTIRGAFDLRRPLARVGAVLSALALAACQPIEMGASGPQTGPAIDPSQPVQVALLVPGGNADLDWLARSLTNSAKMAASDARGATIDLRVYNAGSEPGTAVASANKAAAEGAKIILGPLFADSANAVGNAMAPQGINVLSFSNNTDIAGGNVFVLGNTFDNVADRLVKYGVKNGKRRILMVAEDDAAGQVGAQAIQRAIQRNGATLAGSAIHPLSKQGIDGIIPNVASAALSGNVDAVFLTANQGAVLPYLTDKLADAGVTSAAVQMMGLTRWDQPSARLQLRGVQGGWFAIPDTTMKAQFDQRYRSAQGETPHELGSLAYDGVAAIAALVRAGKRNALTTAGLTQNAGFAGVQGAFRLKRDGTNERALAVATVRGNQLVVLDPAPRSFGGFGF
ncbi:amino acid/amide ABC transporter substrate-binding protein, HAAT family [Paracoccus aminovorans]|uniref:Amino acid/amide ABC transporter substrate-binding protein, HAAT family n=1 Tax=Paracoccus aminovorans TaxID=34004 RepID=A0A1I3BWW0_9RHOB|nr:penicillin-binding protein activator [Paracoccus aminovorans]CQR86280.1 ABC transporter substrate-binding protein [Paracoccus aminovorans]SFH66419.1 amino acid/amide ABC transporter substrate-binding protein, HAAT family [Paracoccus aminovorans]